MATLDADDLAAIKSQLADLLSDGNFIMAIKRLVINNDTEDPAFSVTNTLGHGIAITGNHDVALLGSGDIYSATLQIGLLPNDGTSIVNLKQFNIINDSGSAIVAQSIGGDGTGMEIRGSGAGHGVFAQGGDNADGIRLRGGTTGGAALTLQPLGIGPGLNIQASSDNAVKIGGDTGYATIAITSYGSGEAVSLNANGTGHGVSIQAGTGGHDVALLGSGDIDGKINLNLNQTGIIPRDLSTVPDAELTINDAFLSAIALAAGKETRIDTVYTVMTPYTGSIIRIFTLDRAISPTSRS